jgi:hypothetical protein
MAGFFSNLFQKAAKAVENAADTLFGSSIMKMFFGKPKQDFKAPVSAPIASAPNPNFTDLAAEPKSPQKPAAQAPVARDLDVLKLQKILFDKKGGQIGREPFRAFSDFLENKSGAISGANAADEAKKVVDAYKGFAGVTRVLLRNAANEGKDPSKLIEICDKFQAHCQNRVNQCQAMGVEVQMPKFKGAAAFVADIENEKAIGKLVEKAPKAPGKDNNQESPQPNKPAFTPRKLSSGLSPEGKRIQANLNALEVGAELQKVDPVAKKRGELQDIDLQGRLNALKSPEGNGKKPADADSENKFQQAFGQPSWANRVSNNQNSGNSR